MTTSKLIDTEPVAATDQEPFIITDPGYDIASVARFEDLHRRFRSVIMEVLRHLETLDSVGRTRLAFVKRLFTAWQTLKDPVHAASPCTLWSALRRFEAEVALAECELDCLEFERATHGRSPTTLTDQSEDLSGRHLALCGSGYTAFPADGRPG